MKDAVGITRMTTKRVLGINKDSCNNFVTCSKC